MTLSCALSADCEYKTASTNTPSITNIAKTTGNTKLEVTISNFSFDNTYKVVVYYGNLKVNSDTIDSATVIKGTFPNGFPPGEVDVRISFEKGNTLTFTKGSKSTITLAATLNAPVVCSWAGG